MRRQEQTGIMALLFMALVGCAFSQTASSVVYRDASLTVRLEPNPAGTSRPITETDAQYVTAEQLAFILKGLKARQRTGLLQSLLTPSEIPVRRPRQLRLAGRRV